MYTHTYTHTQVDRIFPQYQKINVYCHNKNPILKDITIITILGLDNRLLFLEPKEISRKTVESREKYLAHLGVRTPFKFPFYLIF